MAVKKNKKKQKTKNIMIRPATQGTTTSECTSWKIYFALCFIAYIVSIKWLPERVSIVQWRGERITSHVIFDNMKKKKTNLLKQK